MSLQAIKHLVAGLHSDKDLKDRFGSKPDEVMAQFKLSAKERTAIKQAHFRVQADGTLVLKAEAGTLDWWWS
ncbi:MAG: hypothetical protein HYU86_01810 [Chloroflexi bacterium]|nr:hypothetical protein [Chloroflexota bacterium]